MPLTDEERVKVRYHLGFPQISPSQSLAFGAVIPTQANFLIEASMNNLIVGAEEIVRSLICTLDEIECLMRRALPDLQVSRTGGGVELDTGYNDRLEAEYNRFAGRLADVFAVPFHPYAMRFSTGLKGVAKSIPVVG